MTLPSSDEASRPIERNGSSRQSIAALPLTAQIEAVLFVADGPVELDRLRKALEVERQQLEHALELLGADLSQRGIRLQRSRSAAGIQVQLVSSPEATTVVERFLGIEAPSKLSSAALETLAVVAYRQPITRAQVEAIRGVNADRALATLQARGLIDEVGRLDTPGRPVQFGTTTAFLEYFGLQSLEDLPPLPPGMTDLPEDSSPI